MGQIDALIELYFVLKRALIFLDQIRSNFLKALEVKLSY